MSAPTAEELDWVSQVSSEVHRLGGAWFFADEVRAHGAANGIDDHLAFYAGGRGGVLGDPTGHVVAAAFAFFPPHIVMGKFAVAMEAAAPERCGELYAEALQIWGRSRFADVPGIERAAELGFALADGALAMGAPLFAGWRAMPRPDDGPAAAAMALQVLREMRGDAHVHAVVAAEMSPLEAIIGKDGPERAAELFYPEPYPSIQEVAERRAAVEATTNRLVASAYLALSPADRAEFTSIVADAARRLPDSPPEK